MFNPLADPDSSSSSREVNRSAITGLELARLDLEERIRQDREACFIDSGLAVDSQKTYLPEQVVSCVSAEQDGCFSLSMPHPIPILSLGESFIEGRINLCLENRNAAFLPPSVRRVLTFNEQDPFPALTFTLKVQKQGISVAACQSLVLLPRGGRLALKEGSASLPDGVRPIQHATDQQLTTLKSISDSIVSGLNFFPVMPWAASPLPGLVDFQGSLHFDPTRHLYEMLNEGASGILQALLGSFASGDVGPASEAPPLLISYKIPTLLDVRPDDSNPVFSWLLARQENLGKVGRIATSAVEDYDLATHLPRHHPAIRISAPLRRASDWINLLALYGNMVEDPVILDAAHRYRALFLKQSSAIPSLGPSPTVSSGIQLHECHDSRVPAVLRRLPSASFSALLESCAQHPGVFPVELMEETRYRLVLAYLTNKDLSIILQSAQSRPANEGWLGLALELLRLQARTGKATVVNIDPAITEELPGSSTAAISAGDYMLTLQELLGKSSIREMRRRHRDTLDLPRNHKYFATPKELYEALPSDMAITPAAALGVLRVLYDDRAIGPFVIDIASATDSNITVIGKLTKDTNLHCARIILPAATYDWYEVGALTLVQSLLESGAISDSFVNDILGIKRAEKRISVALRRFHPLLTNHSSVKDLERHAAYARSGRIHVCYSPQSSEERRVIALCSDINGGVSCSPLFRHDSREPFSSIPDICGWVKEHLTGMGFRDRAMTTRSDISEMWRHYKVICRVDTFRRIAVHTNHHRHFLVINSPNEEQFIGIGTGSTLSDALNAACQEVLSMLAESDPSLRETLTKAQSLELGAIGAMRDILKSQSKRSGWYWLSEPIDVFGAKDEFLYQVSLFSKDAASNGKREPLVTCRAWTSDAAITSALNALSDLSESLQGKALPTSCIALNPSIWRHQETRPIDFT